MNPLLKKALLSFFLSGFVFAAIMAFFDYDETGLFVWSSFAKNWLVFGTAMALLNYYTLWRNSKKQNKG